MKNLITVFLLMIGLVSFGNDTITYSSFKVPLQITATDNVGVIISYIIKESSVIPEANDTNWSKISYEFKTEGVKTLYSFVKDAAGNVSEGKQMTIRILVPDSIIPVITNFYIQTSSVKPTILIKILTATDNKEVTGYFLSESSTIPNVNDVGWSATVPVSYTFTSAGQKRLYAWVKDAAGNISLSKSRGITVKPEAFL